MPMERTKLRNNYVVYSKVTKDGIYSFPENAVKVIDTVTDDELVTIIPIVIPKGRLVLRDVLNFIKKVEMLPVYNNTVYDILISILLGTSNLTVTLLDGYSIKITEGDTVLFSGTPTEDENYFEVVVNNTEPHVALVTTNEYYRMLSKVISRWSDDKLRVNYKKRKKYAN